jgi:hypothetical protein
METIAVSWMPPRASGADADGSSLSAPDRLGWKVRKQPQQGTSGIWLSPISVWELLVLAERGLVRLDEALIGAKPCPILASR